MVYTYLLFIEPFTYDVLSSHMDHTFGVQFKMSFVFVISKEIQTGGNVGHDPCEDALAALDLVLHRLHKGQ